MISVKSAGGVARRAPPSPTINLHRFRPPLPTEQLLRIVIGPQPPPTPGESTLNEVRDQSLHNKDCQDRGDEDVGATLAAVVGHDAAGDDDGGPGRVPRGRAVHLRHGARRLHLAGCVVVDAALATLAVLPETGRVGNRVRDVALIDDSGDDGRRQRTLRDRASISCRGGKSRREDLPARIPARPRRRAWPIDEGPPSCEPCSCLRIVWKGQWSCSGWTAARCIPVRCRRGASNMVARRCQTPSRPCLNETRFTINPLTIYIGKQEWLNGRRNHPRYSRQIPISSNP